MQKVKGLFLIFFGAAYTVLFEDFVSESLHGWCQMHNVPFALVEYLFGFVPCVILVAIGVRLAKAGSAFADSRPSGWLR